MADFVPDERIEKFLSLLDRAMKGDKEIMAQILQRRGFSKEELAPIIAYANRRFEAQLPKLSADDEQAVKDVEASPEEVKAYRAKGSTAEAPPPYEMFLRDEPAEIPPQDMEFLAEAGSTPAEVEAYRAKLPRVKPQLPKLSPDGPDQEVGAAALKMLDLLVGPKQYSTADIQPASQPAEAPPMPMPNTVLDSYGRPLDSPAQQLEPTDDISEIQRRLEDGARKKKQLQERYKAAQ